MTDFIPAEFDTDFAWDGFEDESDWEYAMQFDYVDEREDDGWSERYMGEDEYLDSYWEGLVESQAAFWGGE